MEISFCENQGEWDNFILENSNSFLQAFEWGQMQSNFDRKIVRMKVTEGQKILAQAQMISQKIMFGSYLYIPYGPIFDKNLGESERNLALKSILNEVKKVAAKEKSIFLRIEPFDNMSGIKGELPFVRFQPRKTLVLDLGKSEEELFKSFSRTTKYNIGLAQRKGIKIVRKKEYIKDFYDLMQKTKDRQEFGIHTEEYYKKILGINGQAVKSELVLAEYDNKTINATLMLFFGDTATTLHAGSDYNYRQIKGPNLLEWEIILAAKREGFKKIDFWGVDEKKWPGLTAFKKGFGGEEISYPEGLDLVFNNLLYILFKFVKAVRK